MYILVIEDDRILAEFLKRTLKQNGDRCDVAYDGLNGQDKAKNGKYDVIILDVLLPYKDGYSICSDLRKAGITTPILILSSQMSEDQKVTGLDAGADDYLQKPFSNRELKARLRALTRRPSVVVQSSLSLDDLIIDPDKRVVMRDNQVLELRPKEYDLLEYMLRNPDRALKREEILKNVWGITARNTSNRLDVYIRYLREKVDYPGKKQLIRTVRGVGYKIANNA